MHNLHGYHYFDSPHAETSNEQRFVLFSDRFDKLDDPARKCPARRWKMTARRCRRSAACYCCRAADRHTADDFLPTAAPAASAASAVAVAAPLPAATTPPAIVLACGEGGGRLHNSGFLEKKFALQIHVDFFTF